MFREVNERIAEKAEDAPVDATFVCECGDPSCTGQVDVPLERYEQVRAESTHFIVKPGHGEADIERVIERADGYNVVEKDVPEAAEPAEELDPRS